MKYNMGNMVWSDSIKGIPKNSEKLLKRKLSNILESWRGTRYGQGMQAKGVAVDCVRFVFAVMDEMYGRPYAPTYKIPQDTAFHNPKKSVLAMNKLLETYDCHRLAPYYPVEPGDILVTGAKGKGPGHAMIIGPKKNHIWHMDTHFVSRTGPLFTSGSSSLYYLYRIYRIKDKYLWI